MKDYSTTDIQFYRDTVWSLFENKVPTRISNGAPEHARIIFLAMLHFAKSQVKIFCENLNPEVFNSPELVAELKNAIKRNVVVSVFTQKKPSEIEFTNVIKAAENSSDVKQVSNKFLCEQKVNFAVMDSSAFRYEPNKGEVKAFASANEPTACNVLLQNFALIEKL